MTNERVSLPVEDGTSMGCYVSRPTGGGAHPAIIVVMEALGVNAQIRSVTDRYAKAGYLATRQRRRRTDS